MNGNAKYLTIFLAFTLLGVVFWSFVHTRTDVYNRYTSPQDAPSAAARDIRDEMNRQLREKAQEIVNRLRQQGLNDAEISIDTEYRAAVERVRRAEGLLAQVNNPPVPAPVEISIQPSLPQQAPQSESAPEEPKFVPSEPKIEPSLVQIDNHKWRITLPCCSEWYHTNFPLLPGKDYRFSHGDRGYQVKYQIKAFDKLYFMKHGWGNQGLQVTRYGAEGADIRTCTFCMPYHYIRLLNRDLRLSLMLLPDSPVPFILIDIEELDLENYNPEPIVDSPRYESPLKTADDVFNKHFRR